MKLDHLRKWLPLESTPQSTPATEQYLERLKKIPSSQQVEFFEKPHPFKDDEWLEVLFHVTELENRELAIRAVKKSVLKKNAGGLAVLWNALHHPDQWVRRAVVMEVGALRENRLFPFLMEAARDASPIVRQHAVRWMATWLSPQSLQVLLAASQDESVNVRREAVEGLLTQEDRAANIRLAELLNDVDPGVRMLAAKALSRLKAKEAFPLLTRVWSTLKTDVQESAQLLLSMHAMQIPTVELAAYINFADSAIAVCAAEELAAREDPGIPGILARAVLSGGPKLREIGLAALGRKGTLESAEALGEILESRDPSIRSQAVKELGRMDLPQVRHILLRALWDTDEGVRVSAVESLAPRLEESRPGWLIHAAGDASPRVRRAVVKAVTQVRTPWALDLIKHLSQDKDPQVQYPGLRALIEQGVVDEDLRGCYSAILTRFLTDEEEFGPMVRRECARLLVQLGSQKGVTALAAVLNDEDVFIRRAAVDGLCALGGEEAWKALSPLADTRDKVILGTIALTLGRRGDSRSADFLIRAAIELTGPMAKEARELLIKHKFFDLEKLLAAIRSKGGDVSSFVKDGLVSEKALREATFPAAEGERVEDDFVERLIKRIKNGSSSIRKFALEQLPGVKDARIVEPVSWCLNDDDSEIRQMSVSLLAGFLETPGVFEQLSDKIWDFDSAVGKVVIDALGVHKEKRAVKPLIQALKRVSLERRAEVALRRINDKKGLVFLRRHIERQKFLKALRKKAIEQAMVGYGRKKLFEEELP